MASSKRAETEGEGLLILIDGNTQNHTPNGFSITRSDCKAYAKIRRCLGHSYLSIQDDLNEAIQRQGAVRAENAPLSVTLQTIKLWCHDKERKEDKQNAEKSKISEKQERDVSSSNRRSKSPQPPRRADQKEQRQNKLGTTERRRASSTGDAFLTTTIVRINNLTKTVEHFDAALQESLQIWRNIVADLMRLRRSYRDQSFKHDLRTILYEPSQPSTMFDSLKETYRDFQVNNITWLRPYHFEMRKFLAALPPGSDHDAATWNWLLQQEKNDGDDALGNGDNKGWVVYHDSTKPEDIQQGALGNCWFVSAMSLIVLYKKLPLQQIVITPCFQAAGVYALRLCIDGRWEVVIVDDKVPTFNDNLLFSKASNRQLWVPLIEKALAKAYGCYEALVSGHPHEGLSTLTGEPVQSILLPSEENLNKREICDEIWMKLSSFVKSEFLIGAICGRRSQRQQTSYDAIGLVDRHVYSLLNVKSFVDNFGRQLKLICLRNPWGKSDWNGNWHDGDNRWQTHCPPHIAKALQSHQQHSEGIFWMSFEDFLKYFVSFDVCKIRPDWHQKRLTAPFYRAKNRSCLIVLLTVVEPTSVDFMLHQIGLRKKKAVDRDPLDLTLVICSVDQAVHNVTGDGNKDSVVPVDIIGTSDHDGDDGTPTSGLTQRSAFVQAGEFLLPEKQYALVPLSFMAATTPLTSSDGVKGDLCYSLSVHSSRPLFADTQTVGSSFLGKTLLTYVLSFGEETILKEDGANGGGLSMCKTSKFGGVFIFAAKNTSRQTWYYLCLDAAKSNGLSGELRGSLTTKDIIEPNTCQIIQIFIPTWLKQKVSASSGMSCRLDTEIKFRPAHEHEKRSSAPKHDPPIPEASRALLVTVPLS